MKKELVNYAVKNVFRRAMEAKAYLYNEDGTMPQAVRDLCFPAPELAPEVIDEWNRSHSQKEELIDKFIPRNTFVGDFDSAKIILLDNCIPAEYPGEFTRSSLENLHYFCSAFQFAMKRDELVKQDVAEKIISEEELINKDQFAIYSKDYQYFHKFWQFELHTLQNTGLMDAFIPVQPPACSAEENYRRFKMSGQKGVGEARCQVAKIKKYFAQIAWFTLDLEQFIQKTFFYNFGNENAFVKLPYYNYFKNIKPVVLEKVRNAMQENKVIICRNELPLWHKEIDFSNYANFFYLYNPNLPICRGNVGKGCDLSKRNNIDPFDELVKNCSDFLK